MIRSVVLAGLVFLAVVGVRPAGASMWGCTCILCLGAPNPMSIAACVSPLRRLFRDLARGRPFPSCEGESGEVPISVRGGLDIYHDCPAGLVEMPHGWRPVELRGRPGSAGRWCVPPDPAWRYRGCQRTDHRGDVSRERWERENCTSRWATAAQLRRAQCWIEVDPVAGAAVGNAARHYYQAASCFSAR